MPRQNRVTPSGDLIATPEHGTLMGNRGVLHDGEGRIVRRWQGKRWIACLLNYKGRKRAVMTPGRYTELFFLDEATALAAGHRPCAECRRGRFNAFRTAWRRGQGVAEMPTAPEIDDRLHAERLEPVGTKCIWHAKLDDLPDGVFVRLPDRVGDWLLWKGLLRTWSAGGYGETLIRPHDIEVAVLTPPSTVAAIRAGFAPEVHRSAVAKG
jgi:hypothetical protein